MSAPILTSPDQHDLADPTVERNPRRLQKWLTSLPLMNVAESARLLVNALEPLNEQKIAAEERLQLLDLYRVPAIKLFETSGPVQLRQLPMGKTERVQSVDHLEQLCLALAGGYKVVVKALYRDAEAQRPLMLRCLRGATEQLSLALVHSYRFHRPVPPFVFLESHQLYRLARHHGLLTETPDGGIPLVNHYQAAMMLALTDPFHLAEGLVDRYHLCLVRYAGLARIVPGNQWSDDGEGRFALDLRGDSPPRFCVRLQSPLDADEPYLMDAQPAFQAMHQQLLSIAAEKRPQSAEAALLRSLLPEVPSGDLRKDERKADGRWLAALLGVADIHAYLERATAGTAATTSVAAAQPQRLRVMDHSEHGLRLQWQDAGVGEVQVDELMGVLSDSEELLPHMQLAVVRWVRSERDGSMEVGLELISGRPNPVSCRPLGDADATPTQCLFLPSDTDAGTAASLLVPKGLYAPDQRLLLYVGAREVAVRATRAVAEGEGFDHFEFATDAG